ncbi:hypothetical protein Glove_75g69 [Diversispora epigaea]|uniref:Uncharacterized protein n=1 Tax=Diversispora epigaea TaxID=1348612 RepID=A0A397JHZ9_9GLOM|nr:hypothetical protein Glove_75g69 [Diversispora epigaea]
MPHFNFDQKIHIKKSKSHKSTEQSHIQFRQCLFCFRNYYYFTRGKSCKQHSSNILNRVILTPCIGQINCKALKKCDNICKEASENAYRPLFICGKCFINNGGHLYIKPKKEKKLTNCDEQHVNDSSKQLKMIGQWLITIGKSNENKLQNLILFTIAPSIFQILENISLKKCSYVQQTSTTPDIDLSIPSLFHLRIAFQLKNINIDTISMEELNENYCKNLGKEFANKLWNSRKELEESLWFSQVLTSLTRKPKMAMYLTDLLSVLKITSHSNDYERILEKKRMNNTDPRKRLQQNSNIWNLAVIDNIDFKQKTFTYGNIFDTTRETSHTTIRMTFQTELPNPINETKDNEKELISDQVFGLNNTAIQIMDLFDKIFDEHLAFSSGNFLCRRLL